MEFGDDEEQNFCNAAEFNVLETQQTQPPPPSSTLVTTLPFNGVTTVGNMAKIPVQMGGETIFALPDTGSQISVGNVSIVRLLAKHYASQGNKKTFVFKADLDVIGWNEHTRKISSAIFPEITLCGKKARICVFIDPNARHPLILGTSALRNLPLQLINEVTGEKYLPKVVRFEKSTATQTTQTEKFVRNRPKSPPLPSLNDMDVEVSPLVENNTPSTPISYGTDPITGAKYKKDENGQALPIRLPSGQIVSPETYDGDYMLRVAHANHIRVAGLSNPTSDGLKESNFPIATDWLYETYDGSNFDPNVDLDMTTAPNPTSPIEIQLLNTIVCPEETSLFCNVQTISKPLSPNTDFEFMPNQDLLVEYGLAAPAALIRSDSTGQVEILIENPHPTLETIVPALKSLGTIAPCKVLSGPSELIAKTKKMSSNVTSNHEELASKLRAKFPFEIPLILHSEVETPMNPEQRKEKLKTHLDLSHLSIEIQQEIFNWLLEHHENFSLYETDLGNCDLIMHTVDTGDAKPIALPLRRLPFAMRDRVEESINTLLAAGIIRPSSSCWAFPIVPVVKKDKSLRLCVDFRFLNKVTKSDMYPLPRIDDLIDAVGRVKPTVFSGTDCAKGFHQQKVHPDSIPKLAFITHKGLYEYVRMPFGVKNGPATFQRLMQQVLSGIDPDRVSVYLDDILIMAETIEKHKEIVEKVLRRLDEVKLKLNPKKCKWFQSSIVYLGFELSADGVRTDPAKIATVKDWAIPKDLKTLRSFLGFASYYRRYIHNFAKISSPLYDLLKERIPWEWSARCAESFKTLQVRLVTAPVLKYPDFDRPFLMECDGSKEAVAAVLAQKDKFGRPHPIGFVSRVTNNFEKNYIVSEIECLAIAFGFQKFRVYLFQHQVTVVTDHSALTHLLNSRHLPSRLQRWALEIQEFDPQIVYRKGKSNANADALSRKYQTEMEMTEWTPENEFTLKGISLTELIGGQKYSDFIDRIEPDPIKVHLLEIVQTICPDVVLAPPTLLVLNEPDTPTQQQAQQEQFLDPFVAAMTVYKTLGNLPDDAILASSLVNQQNDFIVLDNILYHDSHKNDDLALRRLPIVVPTHLRQIILEEQHGTDLSGHFGYAKIWRRMKHQYWWPNIRGDLKVWVRSCTRCAFQKGNAYVPLAPLRSIPIPEKPWLFCAADLLALVKSTKGHNYVLIVIDHCSKYLAAKSVFDRRSATVAKSFEKIISPMGNMTTLLTDQGNEFMGASFQRMLQKYGIKHVKSTSHHPHGNGLAERAVRTVTSMLAKITNRYGTDWDVHLPEVIWAYNRTPQESTKMSPFSILFGRDPNPASATAIGNLPPENFQLNSDYLSDSLVQRFYLDHARSASAVAKNRQSTTYDAYHHVKPNRFRVGNKVLLYNPPVKLHKLDAVYTGPYIIIDIRNSNAYIRRIDQAHARPQRVHFDRLSHCYPELPEFFFSGARQQSIPSARSLDANQAGEAQRPKTRPLLSLKDTPDKSKLPEIAKTLPKKRVTSFEDLRNFLQPEDSSENLEKSETSSENENLDDFSDNSLSEFRRFESFDENSGSERELDTQYESDFSAADFNSPSDLDGDFSEDEIEAPVQSLMLSCISDFSATIEPLADPAGSVNYPVNYLEDKAFSWVEQQLTNNNSTMYPYGGHNRYPSRYRTNNVQGRRVVRQFVNGNMMRGEAPPQQPPNIHEQPAAYRHPRVVPPSTLPTPATIAGSALPPRTYHRKPTFGQNTVVTTVGPIVGGFHSALAAPNVSNAMPQIQMTTSVAPTRQLAQTEVTDTRNVVYRNPVDAPRCHHFPPMPSCKLCYPKGVPKIKAPVPAAYEEVGNTPQSTVPPQLARRILAQDTPASQSHAHNTLESVAERARSAGLSRDFQAVVRFPDQRAKVHESPPINPVTPWPNTSQPPPTVYLQATGVPQKPPLKSSVARNLVTNVNKAKKVVRFENKPPEIAEDPPRGWKPRLDAASNIVSDRIVPEDGYTNNTQIIHQMVNKHPEPPGHHYTKMYGGAQMMQGTRHVPPVAVCPNAPCPIRASFKNPDLDGYDSRLAAALSVNGRFGPNGTEMELSDTFHLATKAANPGRFYELKLPKMIAVTPLNNQYRAIANDVGAVNLLPKCHQFHNEDPSPFGDEEPIVVAQADPVFGTTANSDFIHTYRIVPGLREKLMEKLEKQQQERQEKLVRDGLVPPSYNMEPTTKPAQYGRFPHSGCDGLATLHQDFHVQQINTSKLRASALPFIPKNNLTSAASGVPMYTMGQGWKPKSPVQTPVKPDPWDNLIDISAEEEIFGDTDATLPIVANSDDQMDETPPGGPQPLQFHADISNMEVAPADLSTDFITRLQQVEQFGNSLDRQANAFLANVAQSMPSDSMELHSSNAQ